MTVAVNSILDLVEARLKLITTANGYNTTVSHVKRAKLTAFKGYDLPALNFWPTNVSSSRLYHEEKRVFKLYVEYHAKTMDRPFSDVCGELAADIIVAINRSTTAPKVSDAESLDLGGAVSDVVFDGYDYEIGQGQEPWCGVLVSFSIEYATDINNVSSFRA